MTVESLDWEAEEAPLARVLTEDLQLQKELLLQVQLLLLLALLLAMERPKVEEEASSVASAPMLLPAAVYLDRVLALVLLWRQWWLQRQWQWPWWWHCPCPQRRGRWRPW